MIALAAGLVLLATSSAAQPSLDISLKPVTALGDPLSIGTLDVTLVYHGVDPAMGQPLVELPLISSNVDSVATTLGDVDASDDRGVLKLTHRDVDAPVTAARDAESGGPARQWTADRTVQGVLRLHYVVPANATLPPRGPAPPFAFSNDGHGVSGSGDMFLLLPPGASATYRTSVRWDFSKAPPRARGVSSYGVGAASAAAPLTAGQLRMSYYMAGDIGVWTAQGSPFFSAWQGTPPFDARALMQWTSRLYGRYGQFFHQTNPPPYGVFMRYNPINAGGGVGLYHSFVTTFGRPGQQGSDEDEVRVTLAHEMFHTFSPYIENPPGLASSWFGEGLATLYMLRLPLRFGMMSPDLFLKNLNYYAGRYYTDPFESLPNSEIPKRFWSDTRIRTLPYDRGMLYFATVDAAVRARSDGRRSLDDLMLGMLAEEDRGKTLSNADWEDQLRSALGQAAVDDFRRFLAGKPPLPPSDAFGPCFARTMARLRRYQLGFDPAVLAEPKRVVRGLEPGSAAAAAGLRDGDEIVDPVPQDYIQGDQKMHLKLKIKRAGRVFELDYLPRGAAVDAYQWRRIGGAPESACAL